MAQAAFSDLVGQGVYLLGAVTHAQSLPPQGGAVEPCMPRGWRQLMRGGWEAEFLALLGFDPHEFGLDA